MGFYRQLFTGVDNQTADLGRVMWAIGNIAFIALTSVAMFAGKYTFEPVTWFAALSGGNVGYAGALAVKARTEPGAAG